MNKSALLSGILAACCFTTLQASAATPSVEDFVKHPAFSSAKISPTGEYLALTVDQGEQDILTVMRTSDLKIIKVNQLPDKKSIGESKRTRSANSPSCGASKAMKMIPCACKKWPPTCMRS